MSVFWIGIGIYLGVLAFFGVMIWALWIENEHEREIIELKVRR